MKASHKKKLIAALSIGLFAVVGTYNALVINTDSQISSLEGKFDRLDEIYDVVKPHDRGVASVEWKKLGKAEVKTASLAKPVVKVGSTQVVTENAPVIQEELNMNLVEVTNSKKWAQGLTPSDFSGSVSTNNGTIESLTVSLPQGESISVAFSEMQGNVFQYDNNGETQSGMMYQVDQNSYMVTLTTGPLEGTRLRFSTVANEEVQAQTEAYLAQNHNMNVGTFGEEASAEAPEMAEASPAAVQAPAFNFNDAI